MKLGDAGTWFGGIVALAGLIYGIISASFRGVRKRLSAHDDRLGDHDTKLGVHEIRITAAELTASKQELAIDRVEDQVHDLHLGIVEGFAKQGVVITPPRKRERER